MMMMLRELDVPSIFLSGDQDETLHLDYSFTKQVN